MQSPLRGLFKLKYFAFGILGLMALRHVISRGVSKKVVRGLLHLFFASIIVSVIYGLTATFADFDLVTWQKGQFDRVGGLTDTMRFGYGMGMVLPVLLTLWLRRREWANWFDVRLLTLALVMGLVGLMLTQTRGALLGLLCAVPLVLYFYRPKAGYWVGGVCGFAIVLLAVGNYLGQERITQLVTGKSQDLPTSLIRGFDKNSARLSLYKAALYGIQERPVFGFGMRGSSQHVPRIKRQHGLKEYPSDTTHAHNTFLEIGANLGILGLVAFLAWLVLWGWESRKRHDAVAVCVLPFLLAFVVSGQFEYLFLANNAFLIFFLYALSSSITGLSKTDQEKEDDCFQPIKYVEVRAEKTTAGPGI